LRSKARRAYAATLLECPFERVPVRECSFGNSREIYNVLKIKVIYIVLNSVIVRACCKPFRGNKGRGKLDTSEGRKSGMWLAANRLWYSGVPEGSMSPNVNSSPFWVLVSVLPSYMITHLHPPPEEPVPCVPSSTPVARDRVCVTAGVVVCSGLVATRAGAATGAAFRDCVDETGAG
jgi:hypothetical protein